MGGNRGHHLLMRSAISLLAVSKLVRSAMFFLTVGKLPAVEIEHEKSYGRRQISLLPLDIDRGDQVAQGGLSRARDLLQRPPKRILEAHAGLVASHDDGPFDD